MLPDPAALEPLSRAVLEALLNALWQGAALAAAAALVLRLLPRTNAATRHLVWSAALAAVAAAPLTPLLGTSSRAPMRAVGEGAAEAVWSVAAPAGSWAPLLLAALGLVAAARVARILRELAVLRRLKASAGEPPPALARSTGALPGGCLPRGARVGVSGGIANPATVGFLRPMVLFPGTLAAALSAEELRQVLLHEAAHLRRRDDWANLAQRLLEAVLWFNPAVRWIGARLELERELACDEQVVAALGERRAYALCLTRLAELSLTARRASLAPGLAPGASQLARRVGALLSAAAGASPRVSAPALAGSLALLALAGTGVHRAGPAVALTVREAAGALTLASVRAEPTAARPARAAEAPPAVPVAANPRTAEAVREPPLPPLPEPRVVVACGAGDCGPALPEGEIVREARAAPRPLRVASRPAPTPRVGERRPALGVTLSLFGGRAGWGPASAGMGEYVGGLRGPLGAPAWKPYAPLRRR